MNKTHVRNRPHYAVLFLMVLLLGLASRRFAWLLPPLLHKNAGDILWALMLFLVFGLLLPRLSTFRTAAISVAFCIGIEVLKLYQAPWINAVRSTKFARLLFGYSFSWSNLFCYLIGIGLAAAIEKWRASSNSRSLS